MGAENVKNVKTERAEIDTNGRLVKPVGKWPGVKTGSADARYEF